MSSQEKPKLPQPFALSSSPQKRPSMTTYSNDTATTKPTVGNVMDFTLNDASMVTDNGVEDIAVASSHHEMLPQSTKRQKNEAVARSASVCSTGFTHHTILTPLEEVELTTAPPVTVATRGIAVAQKSIHDFHRSHAMAPSNSLTDPNMDSNIIDYDDKKIPGRTDIIHDDTEMTFVNEPREGNGVEGVSENMVVDTLSVYLTEDVIIKILNFCNISDLVHGIGMVNRYYHKLSCLDTAGWDTYYTKNILQEKCLIRLPQIPPHKDSKSKRTLYQYAVIDSKRHCITLEELCYDISGTIWRFRFKGAAGTDWTSADPWHQGQPCRKMVFYQNGTVMLACTRPKVESTGTLETNELSTTTTTTVSNNAPTSNGHQPEFLSSSSKIKDDEELIIAAPPLQMTWRFLTRPMDLPTRPIGGYLRLHVGNRDVPTYTCIRSPTNNWGFVFESCWGMYANFDLPPKRSPHTAMIGGDTATGGVDVNINEDATASNLYVGDTERQGQPQQQSLDIADMQDETMLLTNEVQWREAFLYNVGARILPEGDEAAYEFDRFWQKQWEYG